MFQKLFFTACILASLLVINLPVRAGLQNAVSATQVTNLNTGLVFSTIKDAIDASTTLNGHDLLIANGTYSESLVFSKSLSLTGEDETNTVLSGGRTKRIVDVTASVFVTLTNLSLKDGGSSDFRCGAAIFNLGKINVISVTISNASTGNTFDNCGQAVVNRGQMTLDKVLVTANGSSSRTLHDAMISNSESGVLTLTQSIIRDNYGTGLWNDGIAVITNSQILNNQSDIWSAVVNYSGRLSIGVSEISGHANIGQNGGGVFNNSVMSITNSIIRMNSANGDGSGILNNGTLTVTASLIAKNTLGATGSMLSFIGRGRGGGIANTGQIVIINSTLSANIATDAGGAIANYKNPKNPAAALPNAFLTNTTIAYNVAAFGGGIGNSEGEVKIVNTLIGHNSATTGKDCNGAITSNGHNLIANTASCSFNPLSSDKAGTASKPIDPFLGPLGDFGGRMPTVGLRRGSPAINNGDSTICQNVLTDQRGFDRVGVCDIGAFEFGVGPQVLDQFLMIIQK